MEKLFCHPKLWITLCGCIDVINFSFMFAAFIFFTVLYMFLHSFLADNKVKGFFYKHIISERYYRFFFVSYSILFLLPIGYLYFAGDKHRYFNPDVITVFIGWLLIFSSLYVFFISFKNYNIHEFIGLDRLKSDKRVFYPLKTEGINSYVRHPLYTFSYTLMLGLFLIEPNDYILAASIIIAVYLPIGIYFEEKKLIEEYGDKYIEYMKEVPKLFPFVRSR